MTYNRALAVAEALNKMGTENFVPVVRRFKLMDGKRVSNVVPAIPNLIFVHATPDWMTRFKLSTQLPVRYIMDRITNRPLIVPDFQMQNFMAVAGHAAEEDVIYIDPALASASHGTRVRILDGVFAGAEGIFMRIRGDRRVVVSINGIAAVATHFIHPSMVEIIDGPITRENL